MSWRKNNRIDKWLPASGGTEEIITYRTGRRLLYCWNPHLQKHAFIDCDTDRILTDDEAEFARGLK